MMDDYDRWLMTHDRHCRTLRRIERWLWRTLSLAALSVLVVLLHYCACEGALPVWVAMLALVGGTVLAAAVWRLGNFGSTPTEEIPQGDFTTWN